MVPDKFEKQLKDTLERRTIAPSKNAWSQLDTQLDNKQTKPKFTFWWIGIAATIAGVFFAVTMLKNKPNQETNIVDGVKDEVILPNKINTNNVEVVVNNSNDTTTYIKVKLKTETKKATSKTDNSGLASSKILDKKKESLNAVIPEKRPNNTVLAATNNEVKQDPIIEEENTLLNESDLLLKEAYTVVKQNNTNYKSEKIDANSLLEEVEMTSDKSLKNRLFHVVKSGYETLKTTVVERDF